MKTTFNVDRKGGHRWKIESRGLIVNAATQGYATLAKAKANYIRVTTKAPDISMALIVKPKIKRT